MSAIRRELHLYHRARDETFRVHRTRGYQAVKVVYDLLRIDRLSRASQTKLRALYWILRAL